MTTPSRSVLTVALVAILSLAASLAILRSVAGAQPAPALELDAGVAAPAAASPPALSVAPAPDPIEQPVEAIRYVRQVHETDGLPAAIAIALHGLGLLAIRLGRGKWLHGHWLAGVTALTGVALAVAGWQMGDLTVMAVLMAITTGIGQVFTASTGAAPKAAGAS